MRKFKSNFLHKVAIFIFFSITLLNAQEKLVLNKETEVIRKKQIATLDSIQVNNSTQISVKWNEYNIAPILVAGKLDKGNSLQTSASYEQASIKFLKKFKNVFVLNDPQTELKKIQEITDDLGNTHIKFNQYFHGLRVFGAQLIVHFNSLGEIYLFNGRYIPSFIIPINPSISNTEAIRIASTKSKLTEYTSKYELIIFPGLYMKHPILTWNVLLTNKFKPTQQYIIDATKGRILFRDDGVRY